MIKTLANLSGLNIGQLALSFGSRISSTLLSFCLLWIASQALPTNEYGLYVFLFTVGSLVGLTMPLGQQILIIKHFHADDHERGQTNQHILHTNAVWMCIGQAILIALAMVIWSLSNHLPTPYNSLHIALLFAAAFALGEYFLNYFRVVGKIGTSLLPRENVWRALSALAIGVCLWAGYSLNGEQAASLVMLLLFAVVGYQGVVFLRCEGWRWARRNHRPTREQSKVLGRESVFLSLNTLLNACESYLATILIGLVIGLEAAALYFVALRIAMLLSLPLSAIDTINIPRISAQFQANDREKAQKLIGLHSVLAFGMAFVGFVGLALIGGFILSLFDPAFGDSKIILLIVALQVMTDAFFGPGSWLLMIGGGEKILLKARLVLMACYVALIGCLGFLFGLIGVAIAAILLNLATNIFVTRWTMRHWGVDITATAAFRPFLFGGKRVDGSKTAHEDAPLQTQTTNKAVVTHTSMSPGE